jgi:hypothetical protein
MGFAALLISDFRRICLGKECELFYTRRKILGAQEPESRALSKLSNPSRRCSTRETL